MGEEGMSGGGLREGKERRRRGGEVGVGEGLKTGKRRE